MKRKAGILWGGGGVKIAGKEGHYRRVDVSSWGEALHFGH